MRLTRHVAVAIERTSEYGRRFLQGVADYYDGRTDWTLDLLNPSRISDRAVRDYDGWICRITDRRALRLLRETRRPVIDALCLNPVDGFSSVRTDYAVIGALAAEHFLAHGFTRFAFCGYRNVAFSDLRRDAFARHLAVRGHQTHVYRPPCRADAYATSTTRQQRLAEGSTGPIDDADCLTAWLRRLPKPVAVFCCDDFRASDVARICKAAGLAIPDEVAVLGVDNDPVYCLFASPRLSSIDPDAAALGRAAAEMLHARIRARSSGKGLSLMIPPRGIVVRASTDTYPGAPDWLPKALSFIAGETPNGISASDVFRHVGYSRTLVEKTFRKLLGQTVQENITAARIEAAQRLLRTTSLPVKDVAARSGYRSVEYFTRTFCRAVGLPPAAYRQQRENR